ncbi:MAG TPA: CvpA family protein [Nitrolancea sp.]|nr:CvpA family protein [Nitrolancea sp.]
MNTVDIVIVGAFLGIFTMAFFAGIGRSVAGLFALIIAVIAAAIFYKAVGVTLTHVFIPIDAVIARLVAFLVLMLAAGVSADYLIMRSFRISRLRSHLSLELRGGVLGILGLTLVSVIVAALMVTILTQVSNNTVQQLPSGWGTNWMVDEYDGSSLIGPVLRLSPYIYQPIDTITLGIEPSILQPPK